MKKEDIKIWTSALRSGEYEQCQGNLHSYEGEGESSFCCLGVAIDVLIDGDWKRSYEGRYNFNGATGHPTPETAKQLGLGWTAIRTLVEMNDGGSSFTEIADWIEENQDVLVDNKKPLLSEVAV